MNLAQFMGDALNCEATETRSFLKPCFELDFDDAAELIEFVPVRPVRRDANWSSGDPRLCFLTASFVDRQRIAALPER